MLAKRINTESFGREHFFREFGFIFHFVGKLKLISLNKDESKYPFLKKYSSSIVKQMIKGCAIELMDGDNSFIWTEWIDQVL